MKKNILFLFILFLSQIGYTQVQTITICSENKGCEFAKVTLNKHQIDAILVKPNFLAKEKGVVILNLVECISTIEKNKTLQVIHEAHGGKGTIKEKKNFDLRKYLFEKGCLVNCPNTTKRISFEVITDEFNGSGFYFHNIQAEESFMPNESWQQLYQGEMNEVVMNTFLKKNENTSYTIAEGNKWKVKMPYGTIFNDLNNLSFSNTFHAKFKKTGNKKSFLNTNDFQFEYIGKDAEGKKMVLWLGPGGNVCFANGKAIGAGFFNLGYLKIDGITYLITELSGSNFNVKVTEIEEGSYSFDTTGYKEIAGF
ncbi:hypothetical protein GOQ30_13445 [Flavobacterium sp. TP390]|uniref:Uncharacterized protein n=1 Tax=Flavobacterium profundi TaxID=1774945 RepID=A0A6I4ITH0_9FLAO|nr:hypothetical protein [Flavobacterium profundi]MVO10171.1 hypothetical protein [Flavobacterium profundi]